MGEDGESRGWAPVAAASHAPTQPGMPSKGITGILGEEGKEGTLLETYKHQGGHGWLLKGLETSDMQQELECMKKCVCA